MYVVRELDKRGEKEKRDVVRSLLCQPNQRCTVATMAAAGGRRDTYAGVMRTMPTGVDRSAPPDACGGWGLGINGRAWR